MKINKTIIVIKLNNSLSFSTGNELYFQKAQSVNILIIAVQTSKFDFKSNFYLSSIVFLININLIEKI